MSLFDQDLGCCGASFEKNNVSFIGLLTFSATLILCLGVLYIVTLPLYVVTRKIHFYISVVMKANLDLIKNNSLMRRTKCEVAGKILRYSPGLSGIFFKSFNYAIIFSCWFLIAGGVWTLTHL